jgi:PAS domain S-box-containing protein
VAADERTARAVSGSGAVSLQQVTAAAVVAEGPRVPILVVDDDSTKRFYLNRLLSPLGYHIVEADSGRAALRCLLAEDFAVILLDIRMPEMDGFETAALIRTRRRSELTPIILTTASTRDEIVASGVSGGAVTDFMFASVDPAELRATILTFGNLFLQAQKRAAQAHETQAAADRWRLLIRAVPVGIFQTDVHHRYTHTNPRWSEITGIAAEAALGQDWKMIVDAEREADLVARSGPDAARRAEMSLRIEIRRPGSAPKSVMLTSTPILGLDGAVVGWAGSLTDVTDSARVVTARSEDLLATA